MTNRESVVPGVREEQRYYFKLYVAGDEQNSLARENLEHICNEELQGQCRIEEVDVLTDFASALADRVFVTPTLILMAPAPRATIVGNLGDRERVVSALRLRSERGA